MSDPIKVLSPSAEAIDAKVYVRLRPWRGHQEIEATHINDEGAVVLTKRQARRAERLIVLPQDPGYWRTWAPDVQALTSVICPEIDARSTSWWHQLLGNALCDPQRGKGIKIGVVDLGFTPDQSLDQVRMLTGPPASALPLYVAHDHGEAVCRILADQDAPPGCTPIAPGAELFFADGAFSSLTLQDVGFSFPVAGAVEFDDHLDPTRVVNAIFEMVRTHEVDIINLSLGTFYLEEIETTGLRQMIAYAADRGVTVVCAAGNEHLNGAAFPASLHDALGIGAYGASDWAPPFSVTRDFDEPSAGATGRMGDTEVFLWAESAYGPGVDGLGPGVGILVARNGFPAFDLSGTSFAAPIVTGLLAVELARDSHYLRLPRDRTRTQYVQKRFAKLCRRTGMEPQFEGQGAVTLHETLTPATHASVARAGAK